MKRRKAMIQKRPAGAEKPAQTIIQKAQAAIKRSFQRSPYKRTGRKAMIQKRPAGAEKWKTHYVCVKEPAAATSEASVQTTFEKRQKRCCEGKFLGPSPWEGKHGGVWVKTMV